MVGSYTLTGMRHPARTLSFKPLGMTSSTYSIEAGRMQTAYYVNVWHISNLEIRTFHALTFSLLIPFLPRYCLENKLDEISSTFGFDNLHRDMNGPWGC